MLAEIIERPHDRAVLEVSEYETFGSSLHTMSPYPDAKTFTEGYLKATKQLKGAIEKMS